MKGYVRSIFSNMISNAVKYRSLNRKLNLHIRTIHTDNAVLLSFQDNGIGIDLEKFKDKLFSPFHRFSPEIDGRGIGLYLVKNMVESNGGTLSVTSTVNEGTEFTFRLIPFEGSLT